MNATFRVERFRREVLDGKWARVRVGQVAALIEEAEAEIRQRYEDGLAALQSSGRCYLHIKPAKSHLCPWCAVAAKIQGSKERVTG